MSREYIPTEKEIKKHLEELVEEINFRLLMEQYVEQILWLDQIDFISYRKPRGSCLAGIWRRIREFCGSMAKQGASGEKCNKYLRERQVRSNGSDGTVCRD